MQKFAKHVCFMRRWCGHVSYSFKFKTTDKRESLLPRWWTNHELFLYLFMKIKNCLVLQIIRRFYKVVDLFSKTYAQNHSNESTFESVTFWERSVIQVCTSCDVPVMFCVALTFGSLHRWKYCNFTVARPMYVQDRIGNASVPCPLPTVPASHKEMP